jgi:hypothetical protein
MKKKRISKSDLRDTFLNLEEEMSFIDDIHFFSLFSFIIFYLGILIVYLLVFENIVCFFIFCLIILFPISNRIRLSLSAIKDYRYETDEEISAIVNDLNLFFKGDATRRRKTINSIIKKIEDVKIKSKKLSKIDKIHSLAFGIFIYIYGFYSIFLVLDLTYRPDLFEFHYLPYIYELGAGINIYLLIFFGTRKNDLRNLQRGVDLFKIYFENKQDEIINNINIISKKDIDKIEPTSLIETLTEWYKLYSGKIFNNEFDEIISNNHYLFFNLKEERYHHESLFSLKIKIQDILYMIEMELNKENNSNNQKLMKQLILILNITNNYLQYLKYNIDYKVNKKRDRRERIKTVQVYIYILTTIIGFIIILPVFSN